MMPKDDIDDLLGAIFSNGKLNLNPVVKPSGTKKQEPAQVLQQNMEDIAAMNESVRRELEELDQNMRKDGLASSVSSSPAVDTPRREAAFATLAETIKKHIIGQDAFVEELAKAFEGAFLLQGTHASPRAVLMVTGAAGSRANNGGGNGLRRAQTGGALAGKPPVSLDLSAYPSADSQKVFVQICIRRWKMPCACSDLYRGKRGISRRFAYGGGAGHAGGGCPYRAVYAAKRHAG